MKGVADIGGWRVQLPPSRGPTIVECFVDVRLGGGCGWAVSFRRRESGMSDCQRTIEESPPLLSAPEREGQMGPHFSLSFLKCYLPVAVLPSPGKTECCLLMPSFFPL